MSGPSCAVMSSLIYTHKGALPTGRDGGKKKEGDRAERRDDEQPEQRENDPTVPQPDREENYQGRTNRSTGGEYDGVMPRIQPTLARPSPNSGKTSETRRTRRRLQGWPDLGTGGRREPWHLWNAGEFPTKTRWRTPRREALGKSL